MGLGGATLLPSGLAVLGELFPNPRQRAQAIGIFAATFAAGFAIGPVLGGLLLNRFAWGSVFLINLPVVVLFLGPPRSCSARSGRPVRAASTCCRSCSPRRAPAVVYAIKDFAA